MSYEILEKTYKTLNEEQQMIVYNLIVSLGKLNEKNKTNPQKREFGKFAKKAKVSFSENWEITESELLNIWNI